MRARDAGVILLRYDVYFYAMPLMFIDAII